MNAYLLRHAINNIWCNPAQDRQYVYKLNRLTPRYGLTNQVRVFYEQLPLPVAHTYFHVYQIGQVVPQRIGLSNRSRQWWRLSQVMEEENLMTNLYVESGIEFPRTRTWIRLTPSRNLLIAVEINDRIHDLEDHTLYMRFYSNAYFQSKRSGGDRQIRCAGLQVKDQDQLLGFQRDTRKRLETLDGGTFYYVNGRLVSNISLTTAGEEDVVEYVFDSSIKQVVDIPVAQLESFRSTLDDRRKFLVRPNPKGTQQIDYADDLDIYLTRPTIGTRFMGVYYHHNDEQWLRMVTHCDYAIPADRLESFVRLHPDNPQYQSDPTRWPRDAWVNTSELTLRVVIRHSGYARPLVANANRIDYLYALPQAQISRAMLGVDSTLELWRADVLEACAYTRFMSALPAQVYPLTYGDIHKTSVEKEAVQAFVGDVYGYHAAGRILADTPSRTYRQHGRLFADLAYEHRDHATCFEYDQEGLLLGWYYHVLGQYYLPYHDNCARVETLSGRGGDRLATVYGNDPVAIPPGYNMRLYLKRRRRQQPLGDWQDITEAENLAEYGYLDDVSEPHRWVWTLDDETQYGAVRTDDYFLCYELSLALTDGQLRFTLTSRETHQDVESREILDLPFGQLDLVMNGCTLTEGVDYTVNWPEVVIHNRTYLEKGKLQTFLIRGYGLCLEDLQRQPITETGFIEHGVMSYNPRYDLFGHKVLRIVVDGRYIDRQDVVWDEQRNQLRIQVARNGAPYHVMTPPITFRDVYDNDRQARRKDDTIDRAVSDYLTEFYGHPKRPDLDDIIEPYPIISPFANKLIHDVVEGLFNPEGMYQRYSDVELERWMAPYADLLTFDPANRDIDTEHLRVYPHWHDDPVKLNLWQYTLIQRACALLQRHPVDLTGFVIVGDYYDFETTPLDLLDDPKPLVDFGMTATSRHVVIFGGRDAQGLTNTTYRISADTYRLEKVAVEEPPTARRFAGMTTVFDSVYLVGGDATDTTVYQLRNGIQWRRVTTLPYAMTAPAVVGAGRYLYSHDCVDGVGRTLRTDVYTLTTDVLADSKTSPTVTNAVLVYIGDVLYLFGGQHPDNTVSNTVWWLASDGDTWRELDIYSDRPDARLAPSHYVVNGKLYIYGGRVTDSAMSLLDYWELDPARQLWTPLPSPLYRREHDAVIRVGEKVLRLGGR